jgi:hypothetical protein
MGRRFGTESRVARAAVAKTLIATAGCRVDSWSRFDGPPSSGRRHQQLVQRSAQLTCMEQESAHSPPEIRINVAMPMTYQG